MYDHKLPFEASPGPDRSSAYRVRIDTWEDVPRAIAAMQVAGAGFRVPLLQGLYHGMIAFLDVSRETSSGTVKRFISGIVLPAVVVIGDDDDLPSGPDGFAPAQRLLKWAHQVVIHGAGGEAEHYRAAVLAAQITGRFLMVECSSPMIPAWTAAARKWATNAVVQVVQPAPGLVHPKPWRREAMQ